jgi:integrase
MSINIERRQLHRWIPGAKHKNGKPHSVPLNEMALSVLRKQIGKHPSRLFTFRGEPIRQVNTKAWTAALKRARFDGLKWHDLRHNSGSWIIPSASSSVLDMCCCCWTQA